VQLKPPGQDMLIGGFFVGWEEETWRLRLTFRGRLEICPVSRADPLSCVCSPQWCCPFKSQWPGRVSYPWRKWHYKGA